MYREANSKEDRVTTLSPNQASCANERGPSLSAELNFPTATAGYADDVRPLKPAEAEMIRSAFDSMKTALVIVAPEGVLREGDLEFLRSQSRDISSSQLTINFDRLSSLTLEVLDHRLIKYAELDSDSSREILNFLELLQSGKDFIKRTLVGLKSNGLDIYNQDSLCAIQAIGEDVIPAATALKDKIPEFRETVIANTMKSISNNFRQALEQVVPLDSMLIDDFYFLRHSSTLETPEDLADILWRCREVLHLTIDVSLLEYTQLDPALTDMMQRFEKCVQVANVQIEDSLADRPERCLATLDYLANEAARLANELSGSVEQILSAIDESVDIIPGESGTYRIVVKRPIVVAQEIPATPDTENDMALTCDVPKAEAA